MGEKRQKATDGTTRSRPRQQRPVGRVLAGAGAFAALGVLAACSGGAANTADRLSNVVAKPGTSAVSGSVQGLGEPAMISQAIAVGRSLQPTPTASGKQSKQAKAANSKTAAQPSASGSTAGGGGQTGSGSGGQSGGDPSGENPSGSLPGFTLSYVQEFNGNSAPANWHVYDNQTPGGESSSQAQWESDMCTFSGGEAHFMASGIDSCGMQYLGTPQEYGAFFARLQADDNPSGDLFSDIFLLWPSNYQWPPEIDIYEDKADRTRTTATMFNTVGNACGSSPSISCLTPYSQSNDAENGVANDDTQWHTYGVEWTPSGVEWLIDGNVVLSAPSSQTPSGAQQPALPMLMTLQAEDLAGGAGAPSGTQTMAVDWVEQFSWNG
jgi:hypothetical protein